MAGILKFIEKVCVQTAVYWSNPTDDGYGQKNFPVGDEIKVRWDGKMEVVTDKYGKEIISRAEILVQEDIDENGFMYLGSLEDLKDDEQANPEKVEKAYPIQRFTKVPLIKSTTEFVRKVYL